MKTITLFLTALFAFLTVETSAQSCDTTAYGTYMRYMLYGNPEVVTAESPYALAGAMSDYSASTELGPIDTTGFHSILRFYKKSTSEVLAMMLNERIIDQELHDYLAALSTDLEKLPETTTKEQLLSELGDKRTSLNNSSMTDENRIIANCVITNIESGVYNTDIGDAGELAIRFSGETMNDGAVMAGFSGPSFASFSNVEERDNLDTERLIPDWIVRSENQPNQQIDPSFGRCGFFCQLTSIIVGVVVGVVAWVISHDPVFTGLGAGLGYLYFRCCVWDGCSPWDPNCYLGF